jgi:hypothetical protein
LVAGAKSLRRRRWHGHRSAEFTLDGESSTYPEQGVLNTGFCRGPGSGSVTGPTKDNDYVTRLGRRIVDGLVSTSNR